MRWPTARVCGSRCSDARRRRPTLPLVREVPAEGLHVPVIFVDPQAIEIGRFYSRRLPGHAPGYSNLLTATARSARERDLPDPHWPRPLNGGDSRLADAMRLRRVAKPGIPPH